MGAWFYLLNLTKKEKVVGNYGKYGEFDLNDWIKAKEGIVGWDDTDHYVWISDEGELIELPMKNPYPNDSIWNSKTDEYNEQLDLDWYDENVKNDNNYYDMSSTFKERTIIANSNKNPIIIKKPLKKLLLKKKL